MKRKVGLLLCVVLFLGFAGCGKENRYSADNFQNEKVSSQSIGKAPGEQWLSVADSGSNEADALEKSEVFLVEPLKTVDQVASNDESQSVINLISGLSADDFAGAMIYDPNELKPLPDNQVMLLFQSEKTNTEIYGYKSAEYGARGIIVGSNGKYSYFDFCWNDIRGGMGFYEQDFDHDGMMETAFCFLGASGTGVNIYRLVVFDDTEGTGVPAAYEFTPEMQLEQFESILQFIVDMEDKKLRISKNGVTETTIDWGRFGDVTEGNRLGIDCLNQISFEINEDRIKMRAGIGILMNQGDAAIFFAADEGGELSFDVRYSDGVYEIN